MPEIATFHIPGHHIPQHTIFHITFCISATFHLTPCLKLQHSTLHHISHCTVIHIKSQHHISVHHSTSRPHSTSHHTMLITILKYKLHITLSHSAKNHTTLPTLTAFQPSFRITPCLIWHQTIPHHWLFNSHISHLASQHTTIFPMHYTIIPHCITTFHTSSEIAQHYI